MSYPERKKKKKEEKPSLLLSLPEDLLLTCIARVSRLFYSTLYLVSKRFGSLLASPELYKVRSLLGRTESCIYVCLNTSLDHYDWFTLSRKPDQNLTNDTETVNVLCKAPAHPCTTGEFSNLVAVGPHIYKIGGGFFSGEPSSAVSILDCRSHTWRKGPRLRVELKFVTTCVLDQNIYVTGVDSSCKNAFQVLDTTTQMWDPEPIPCPPEAEGKFLKNTSRTCDGKFHMLTSGGEFAYYPKERKWDLVGRWGRSDSNLVKKNSYSQIGNVLYCVSNGMITWYDNEKRRWRILEGLGAEGLPDKFPHDSRVRLADYGGKMVVFWKEKLFWNIFKSEIWCAVIELERSRISSRMLGKVEWCDLVLKDVSFLSCNVVKVLTVTL